MPEERELDGIKREAEELAEYLDEHGDCLDSDEFAGMLRMLVKGHTAATIAQAYELDTGV